jgi:hypothetical protein
MRKILSVILAAALIVSLSAGLAVTAGATAGDTHNVDVSGLTDITVASGTTGTGAATEGADYALTLAAEFPKLLPDDVTVTIGGAPATKGTEYVWDSSTGELTITGAYVTGDITISAAAVYNVPDWVEIGGVVLYSSDAEDITSSSVTSVGGVYTLTCSTAFPAPAIFRPVPVPLCSTADGHADFQQRGGSLYVQHDGRQCLFQQQRFSDAEYNTYGDGLFTYAAMWRSCSTARAYSASTTPRRIRSVTFT